MMNRVLILSVSRKVSLVKAFKDAGWHVTGADNDPNAVALKFCNEVAERGVEVGIDLIIPTRDAELKHGTHRASDQIIDICTDKLWFGKWCEANSFNTPKTLYAEKTRDRGCMGAGFIKPRFSSSQNKTSGYEECVCQEVLYGEEYSVDLFAWNGQVISIVPRKRVKVVNGESVVTTTVENSILVVDGSRLATTLGLVGHNVLQCFLVNGEPFWTDVNCRFGGASAVAIEAGCKSPEWLLKIVNGEEIKPSMDYKVGVTGYSYSEWAYAD